MEYGTVQMKTLSMTLGWWLLTLTLASYAVTTKTYIQIREPDFMFEDGQPKFVVSPGDILEVTHSQTCLSGSGECWKVLNSKTGESGYVPAMRMKRRHYVYSAVAERPGAEGGSESADHQVDEAVAKKPGTEDGSVNLELLMRATSDVSKKEVKQKEISWKKIYEESRDKVKQYTSLCSKAILYDYTLQDKDSMDHKRWVFRFDHSSPNRWHVRQLVWYQPGKTYDFDEWIVIGKEWFSAMGVGNWIPSNRSPGRETLQKMLSPSYILKRVKGLKPNSISEFRYQDDLVIEFRFEVKKLSGLLKSDSGACNSKNAQCERILWFDASSNNLIKSTTTVLGRQADDTELNLEWIQAFNGYDEKIEVHPPESLQAERKKDGTMVIKPSKKSYVPFHDC